MIWSLLRLGLFGLIAIIVAWWLILGGGIANGPSSETFRYKLTINVTVDGRPYSASSVIEARQVIGRCLLGNSRCIPKFSVKGVAPMIRLPDGAVIFASLSGYVDPVVGGRAAARLPWLIYLDEWPRGNVIAKLPGETPRLTIPFVGHPKSKFRPPMRYYGPTGPGGRGTAQIGPGVAKQRTGRAIQLVTFVIEPTDRPLSVKISGAPTWFDTMRADPKYRGTISILEKP